MIRFKQFELDYNNVARHQSEALPGRFSSVIPSRPDGDEMNSKPLARILILDAELPIILRGRSEIKVLNLAWNSFNSCELLYPSRIETHWPWFAGKSRVLAETDWQIHPYNYILCKAIYCYGRGEKKERASNKQWFCFAPSHSLSYNIIKWLPQAEPMKIIMSIQRSWSEKFLPSQLEKATFQQEHHQGQQHSL